ncbi:MAG: trypsin-like peptidase domain-containing protein [Actinomycetes bacterium]
MTENQWNPENIPVADPVWTPVQQQSPLPPPPPVFTSMASASGSAASQTRHSISKKSFALVTLAALIAGTVGGIVGSSLTSDDNSSSSYSAPLLVASDGDADENAIGTTQIAKVAASVAPSVVTISSTLQSAAGAGESVGTGIFLTAAGEILTNAHVVEGATKIQVRLYNETEPRAGKVLAADVGNDLALVKIEGTHFKPAQFADPKAIRIGDAVIAIGYALNLDGGPSVTTGIVSALNRTITTENGALNGLIQTDTAISSGNSGGPLVNYKAEVVGINTAVARGDTSTAANNIGFAVSTKEVLRVVELLRKQAKGETRKEGYLGVGLTDRADGGQGAVIANVQSGSPAAKAGVKEGDVILAINDEPITGRAGMIAIVRDALPEETITMKLERGKEIITVSATLTERTTTG